MEILAALMNESYLHEHWSMLVIGVLSTVHTSLYIYIHIYTYLCLCIYVFKCIITMQSKWLNL